MGNICFNGPRVKERLNPPTAPEVVLLASCQPPLHPVKPGKATTSCAQLGIEWKKMQPHGLAPIAPDYPRKKGFGKARLS